MPLVLETSRMPVSGEGDGAEKPRSTENGSKASPDPAWAGDDPRGSPDAAEARASSVTAIVPSNPWPWPSTRSGDVTAVSGVGREITASGEEAPITNQRPSSKRRTVTVLATCERTDPSSDRA